MNSYLLLAALLAFLMAVNLPLGYLRRGYERFAYGWFFYLHLSLPAVVYLRIKTGYDWKFVPLLLAGAVAGQYLGGICKQRHHDEHALPRQQGIGNL